MSPVQVHSIPAVEGSAVTEPTDEPAVEVEIDPVDGESPPPGAMAPSPDIPSDIEAEDNSVVNPEETTDPPSDSETQQLGPRKSLTPTASVDIEPSPPTLVQQALLESTPPHQRSPQRCIKSCLIFSPKLAQKVV